MSYPEHPGGPYPPRDGQSQYPPPPGEDERARAYHQRGQPPPMTLPSISNAYDQQQPYAPAPNGYPDPRSFSAPQDPYRNAPPMPAYRDDRSYSAEYARGPPPQHMAFTQSAPRQRTAIACRYCRRRKIRCSGFDQSPEGRCSNCQRFAQECIFTPVSSQAQAFVPAHAAYPHMRNMAVGPDGRPRPVYTMYGAHGQPLGPLPPQQAGPAYAEYPTPSPTGSYPGYPDERAENRKRPSAEPHHSVLPPPVPGQPGYLPPDALRRSSAEDDRRLPPVTPNPGQASSNYSPGSSTSSHSGLQPHGLPSLTRTPPPRTSPSEGRADPMAIGNIMEKRPDTDIDSKMLGRLNRKS